MPTYDYRCDSCRKKFTLTMGIREHESKKVKCPKCNSTKVTQLLSAFFAQTSKKS